MHQLNVVDGNALRSVMSVVHAHFGSQREAAKALAISQPSFQKLLTGKTGKRIGAGTFRRLLEVVRRDLESGRELEEQLTSSVYTPEAKELSRRYLQWMGRLDRSTVLPELVRALRQHPDYGGEFDRFLRKVTGGTQIPRGGRVRARRVRLALLRAVEPLLSASSTYGVEPSWQELHEAGRLRDFLRHSLMRELAFLQFGKRPLDRIGQAARSPAFLNQLLAEEEFGKLGSEATTAQTKLSPSRTSARRKPSS